MASSHWCRDVSTQSILDGSFADSLLLIRDHEEVGRSPEGAGELPQERTKEGSS